MNLNTYETNFGAVVIGEKLAALKNDKRTKQGKMKARTLRALDVLAETAYMLDCEIDEVGGGQSVKWETFKECSMEMDSDLRKEWVQKLRDFAEELENYGKD